MSRTEALPTIPISLSRVDAAFSDTSPFLIQVPRVALKPRFVLHTGAPCTAILRAQRTSRPKRRLRRKARVAVALFALLPLPLAAAMARWPGTPRNAPSSSRVLEIPSRVGSGAIAAGQGDVRLWGSATELTLPAPILLSVEPVGPAVENDAVAPVVFPGYLLPDDNHEERGHE
jgi:hypothetical protein